MTSGKWYVQIHTVSLILHIIYSVLFDRIFNVLDVHVVDDER